MSLWWWAGGGTDRRCHETNIFPIINSISSNRKFCASQVVSVEGIEGEGVCAGVPVNVLVVVDVVETLEDLSQDKRNRWLVEGGLACTHDVEAGP